ncbi:hypothetical protein [Marinifilum sp. D737]|uniref:hypothetical protein n=1 Tax=Marinifilum sp. D737 TaxID=2969628 RepID=UPI00227414BB|nr:hypothetical protein [Marinifilum sp. D737]MCY1633947.1 hypothetical protein [Marinifilum sp. D737]
MAKKRKKAKPQVKRKQNNSPYHNSLLRKKYLKIVEAVCEKMNCADSYKLLSKEEKMRAFGCSAFVLKLKTNKKQHYTLDSIQFFERFVNDFFSDPKMCVRKSEVVELTNYELIVANYFISSFNKNYPERYEFLMDAFQPMVEYVGVFDSYYGKMIQHYAFIANATNVFDHNVYILKLEAKIKDYPTLRMNWESSLESIAARESFYKEEGKSRAVFQLGYINNDFEMHWTFVQTKDLKDLYRGNKKCLPVCIQRHAYHRVLSRLKPLFDTEVVWTMNYYLRHDLHIEFYKGRILIPLYYFESKWGYFVATIDKNRLIIKTFLFLTHHSTPEGDKLGELSGLSKEEISYWKIDTLQNFIDTDLRENEQMIELFEKAGLSHLFDMQICHGCESDGKDYNWDALSQYIKRGKTELFDEGAEEIKELLVEDKDDIE